MINVKITKKKHKTINIILNIHTLLIVLIFFRVIFKKKKKPHVKKTNVKK